MGEGFRVRVTQALLDRLAGRRTAGGLGAGGRPAGGAGADGTAGGAVGAAAAVEDRDVQAALGESAMVGGLLLKREGEELAKAQAQARRLIRTQYQCANDALDHPLPSPPRPLASLLLAPPPSSLPSVVQIKMLAFAERLARLRLLSRSGGWRGMRVADARSLGCRSAGLFAGRSARLA